MSVLQNIVINVVVGAIPEILYFYFYFVSVFKLKQKRIFLLLYITLVYIICIIIKKYQVIYYVLFVVLLFIGLRIFNKKNTHISDIFIIGFSFIYLGIVYTISYVISNGDYSRYYISLLLSRILLFLPFAFNNKLHKLYKKYQLLWDKPKEKEKRKLKSITLRNLCLVISFSFIFILYILGMGIIYSFK